MCVDETPCTHLSNYVDGLKWHAGHVLSGLGAGVHRVVVRPVSGTYLDLDAVAVLDGPLPVGLHESDDPRVAYSGSWLAYDDGTHRLTYSADPAARITFVVEGGGFTLYQTQYATRGVAEVCIDDRPCVSVNNYLPAGLTWAVPHAFTGLGAGLHLSLIHI